MVAKKALLGAAVVLLLWAFCSAAAAGGEKRFASRFRPLVTKESRTRVVETESGTITAVDVRDGCAGAYHLQFITLEPSSLFLPVLLHSDMVFYVHTGRGRVSYLQEDYKHGTQSIDVKHGDVYRLEQGSVFYVESNPSPTREKLRIHAVFNAMNIENTAEPFFGAYSNICDLVRGFDEQVLEMGFGVSKEVIQGIISAERPPSIVPYSQNETEKPSWKEGIIEALLGVRGPRDLPNKKKTKTFNFFSGKPDVENCYGWSTAVTNKGLKALKGSNLGAFMVNLTTGAMMGPHWNPKATEIAIVIHGHGMVQVVCPSNPSGQSNKSCECKNTAFRVKEGDVFIVPRFHPMTQISFNNDSFVFVGFSTNVGQNHPQFLAGKRSALQVINKEILAMSFNAPNSTLVEELLASQRESIILSCTSCAEDLAKRTESEEAREREEEEARKRKEEEARKREEEEARKREEEEARRREEEEARKREEEEARRREEEAARRREEEEEAKRREEEEAKRREEEEARRREEEEAARRREEEEEEARGREEGQSEREREGEEEPRRRRREEEEGGGGEAPWEEGGEGEVVRRSKVAAKKLYKG
ncbi:vicilin-like seed storage protein At2g18540 [Ananas comosus]|uniref:Vicilin-like seed storage protein At2g18540 n=1 Tax=Ananas comosus TaxID=4615 RepID=A0A6P5GAY4_ANACO|nr:vicilin-like seed storage protein At2g18540 [Ananas comosus]